MRFGVPRRVGVIVAEREHMGVQRDWSTADDNDLIEACLANDQRAWSAFVDRYRRLVYSIPKRYRFSEDASDDIFQTVFMVAARSLASLQDRASVAKWLITTTHRECWRIKHSRTFDPTESGGPELEDWTPAEEVVADAEARQAVREALTRLDERCRDLIQAVFSDTGEGYDRISQRLGIPRGSIGPTRARCLRKLTSLLTGTVQDRD